MDKASMAALFWSSSLLLLMAAAGTDVRDRRIPDEVSLALAAIGLIQGLAFRPGAVWISIVVAVVVFCGLAVASHFRIVGGGDVKLIAAVSLLVPAGHVGRLLFDIALAGGVLSCIYLAARMTLRSQGALAVIPVSRTGGRPPGRLTQILETERRRIVSGEPMPYAVAILGGVVLAFANEFASCSFALSCSP